MKLYGITIADINATITDPDHQDQDPDGNPRYTRRHHTHPYIRVVVAADNPDLGEIGAPTA